jgi:Leucine-rich repeat (LRR) protein
MYHRYEAAQGFRGQEAEAVEMHKQPITRPWWRHLRISVRGFIFLVLVIGGWLGWSIHCVEVQRVAVEAIGGSFYVSYDRWWINKQNFYRNIPWWRKWLVDRVGIDYFGNVTGIDLLQAGTDAKISHVNLLNQLVYVNLVGSRVTDAGMAHLERLTSLRELTIAGSKITDAGLEHLKGLTGLRYLALGNTRVGDAGLEHIEGLTGLNELFLSQTDVTDSGLAHLKNLKSLQLLNLNDTRVTDAGLAQLEEMPGLQTLTLHGSKVTDAGVQRLQRSLPRLQVIR